MSLEFAPLFLWGAWVVVRNISSVEPQMFAGETRLDDQDAFLHSQIGHWLILKWRSDLFLPPQGQAFGTHLATFILCPHGSEIRGLNFCWLYVDNNERIFRVGEPLIGIDSTWFFKYSTLKNFHAESLSLGNVDFLGLPNFNAEMHADVLAPIREIRMESRLHPFRHPGFPDDVSAICGASFELPATGIDVSGEQVWIRLIVRDSDSRFTGILLNQPAFYGLRKGEQVSVHLLKTPKGEILVCGRCGQA